MSYIHRRNTPLSIYRYKVMESTSFLNPGTGSQTAGATGDVTASTAASAGTQTARRHRTVLAEREASLKGLPEPMALPRLVTSGLDPYVPDAAKPWDRQRAGYLLRRTLLGATRAEIDMALTKSPGEVVDSLLLAGTAPAAPGDWIDDDYWYDNTNNDRTNRERLQELREWWTGLMLRQEFSIREKMTFFWHDHWATEALTVRQPHFNYWFNDLFRSNYLGNFKQMVKDVTIAPAMLIYLDGWYNTRQRPNENYARELMELHTLGEGNGYTEADIQEAARALTGWTLKQTGSSPVGTKTYDPKEAEFITNRFDDTEKTFMGRTGNWGYSDIVDIIFDEHAAEVAAFICRKIYREFVYEIADETIIAQLADILRSNDWDIRPVMSALLRSEHFFDSANIGAHVTSPLEFYIGAIRQLDIATDNLKYVYQVNSALGCQLFEAPNVKGWPGYRSWISASRLAGRWSVADELITGSMRSTPKYSVDAIEYAKALPDPNNPRRLIEDILAYAVPLALSSNQFEILLDKLLAGAPEYEWNINLPGAEGHVKDLLKAVLRLSESQLC
ncbi:MAG: DUF1800 domain-containing protein [Bacteroidota bacterium]|nr:DUF1800 domain-containing protein [Bacteroidota bacterium]